MDPMMMLVVGWTLVGGFVFTMIVTCLSLVGWIRFADKSQQKKLFLVLIAELVVGVGAKALDLAAIDPQPQVAKIEAKASEAGHAQGTLDAANALLDPSAPPVGREQLKAVVDGLRPAPGVVTTAEIEQLKLRVDALPVGAVKSEDAAAIRGAELMRRAPQLRDMRMLRQ